MSATPSKVAFVTGASSGIGRATATLFVEKGYATVLADRNVEQGRAVEEELRKKGECAFVQCDVSDEKQARAAVQFGVKTYGRLDAAFNAAGINGDASLAADGNLENWNRVLGVNLLGLWFCLSEEVKVMRAQGGGAIVNCCSIAGITGAEYLAPYVASKHAVAGLTRAASLDHIRENIRINAVCPGMIDTPMFESVPPEVAAALIAESPIRRFGQPTEIAAAVLWLCDPSASFVSGHLLVADGGFTVR